MAAGSKTGRPGRPVNKATKTVVRRSPNWIFVALAAVFAAAPAGLITSFDAAADPWMIRLAAAIGLFFSVIVVGFARMDTNHRRRSGYIDTQAFFFALNALALVGWLLGMLAVFQLSYEISRGFS